MERKSRRTALFSRNQLRLLIWVLPVIILLLSLLGPDPTSHAIIQSDPERRIYQQTIPDQPHFQLHLVMPPPPVFGASAQLKQRLMTRALSTRLQRPDELGGWLSDQGWDATLQSMPGYRLLQLNSPVPFTDTPLHGLLQQLQIPPQVDWHALLQRAEAEQYLLRQDAEVWLTSQAQADEASPLDPAAEYSRLMHPAHWRMTLTGPTSLSLTLPEASQASPEMTSATSPLTLKPLPAKPATNAPLQLYRWPLPPVNSVDDFARMLLGRELIVQSLSRRLEQQLTVMANPQSGYSLRWDPASEGGTVSLLLRGETWPEPATWLPQQLLHADLEQARQNLLSGFASVADRQPWMNLLALYQLPPDSLDVMSERLALIEADAMQHWLQSQLQSDYYHTFSLPH